MVRHSQSGDVWYEPDIDVQRNLVAPTSLYGLGSIKMPDRYEFDIKLGGFERFGNDVRRSLSQRRFKIGRGQWIIEGDASFNRE